MEDPDARRGNESALYRYAAVIGHQDANWDVMSFDLDADLARHQERRVHRSQRSGPVEVQGPWRQAAALPRLGRPGPAPENTINYHAAVKSSVEALKTNGCASS